MQPCPKMPRQPAKNGWHFPSRSTCWWSRYWTMAWAVVSRLVFTDLFPFSKSAAVGNELQSLLFIRHEIGATMARHNDCAAGVAHARGLVKVPALYQAIDKAGGECVPGTENIVNGDGKSWHIARRLSPL